MRDLKTITAELEAAKREQVELVPISVYSRVTGYYRATKNWNIGKKAEYKERKVFKVGELPSIPEPVCEDCVIPQKKVVDLQPGQLRKV